MLFTKRLDIKMSLYNIKLAANYFAVTHPEGVTDIYKYVFQKMLKKNRVNTFYSSKIIYFTNGQHICIRTLASDELIPMATESYDLTLGQTISGQVMVPLNRECSFTAKENEEYIAEHGVPPKGNSGKKRRNLTSDEAIDFITTALLNKGLSDLEITDYTSGPQINIMNFTVDTIDIAFTAKATDLELFQTAWLHGVGRDKTYGFGMIRLDNSKYIAPTS